MLDLLLDSGFSQDDFLMADVRSITTMLETNLNHGAGTVGWGKLKIDTSRCRIMTIASAFLPPRCRRHGKDDIDTEIAGLEQSSRTNAQNI